MLSKYLYCCCLVAKSCLTLCRLHGLLCPWDFRQEYWSGLPFHSPGNLSDPGIESTSLLSRQILYH